MGDIFAESFDEVTQFCQFAETNGQTQEGAKQLSHKMNDYIARPELGRFAIGISFLVWPFMAQNPSPAACLYATTSAKRILQNITDGVLQRVTRTKLVVASSRNNKKKKSSTTRRVEKAQQQNQQQQGANALLTQQHVIEAVNQCDACFLKIFETASTVAPNARKLIDCSIGLLATLVCALASNREEYQGPSAPPPWPALHEALMTTLPLSPDIAWEFLNEFVDSFSRHAQSLPNLTAYTAEVIKYSLAQQSDALNSACAQFGSQLLTAPSPVLANLFKTVAAFLSLSASDLVMKSMDEGGPKRRLASKALGAFTSQCNAVCDTIKLPLGTFFSGGTGGGGANGGLALQFLSIPQNEKPNVPDPVFDVVALALECLRACICRDSFSQDFQTATACIQSLALLVVGLGPWAHTGEEAIRRLASVAMESLTETVDAIETEVLADALLQTNAPQGIISSVLSKQQQQQQPEESNNNNNNNQNSICVCLIQSLITDWLVLCPCDDGYDNLLETNQDWNVPDRESDVPFKMSRKLLGMTDVDEERQNNNNKKNNKQGELDEVEDLNDLIDDEDLYDDEGVGDENEIGSPVLEDGIARSGIRSSTLSLIGALAPSFPDNVAPIVFNVVSSEIEHSVSVCQQEGQEGKKQEEQKTRASAIAEASYLAIGEILEETFHVIRSNEKAISTLVNSALSAARFDGFSRRPAVISGSLRCAGIIAYCCCQSASVEPDEDDLEDERLCLTQQEVGVVVDGACQMVRHLVAFGLNSRFKRCQWTALNGLVRYVDMLKSSIHHSPSNDYGDEDDDDDDGLEVSDEEEDDDDDEQQGNADQQEELRAHKERKKKLLEILRNQRIQKKKRKQEMKQRREEAIASGGGGGGGQEEIRGFVVPDNERRSALLPVEIENTLIQVLFSPTGSNWVTTSNSSSATSSASSGGGGGQQQQQQQQQQQDEERYIDALECNAVPKIQLMTRSISSSLIKYLTELDLHTARFYDPRNRCNHLVTQRFGPQIVRCIVAAWEATPPTGVMEISLYAHTLQSLRSPLSIPCYEQGEEGENDGGCFFSPLESVAGDIHRVTMSNLDFFSAQSHASQRTKTDGLVAVLVDTISEICDGLALSTSRLVNLNRITGIRMRTVARRISLQGEEIQNNNNNNNNNNSIVLLNSVSSELILTGELLKLSRQLVELPFGDVRRAVFSILSDYAASCFWWRTVVTTEETTFLKLPVDDSEESNDNNNNNNMTLPPFLDTLNPAMRILQNYISDVFQLVGKEIHNYLSLPEDAYEDDPDEYDEINAATTNALWCLSQWFGAAAGPAIQAPAVVGAASSDRNGNPNPNTQLVLDSLPMPIDNMMAVIASLLCEDGNAYYRSALRDNACLCTLRMATLFPHLMGPPASSQPVVQTGTGGGGKKAKATIKASSYIESGFIAAALFPIASLVVPRMDNPTERCEALLRIAALATTPLANNNGDFSAMQPVLEQMPNALLSLLNCVRAEDAEAGVVQAWTPIVQFAAQSSKIPQSSQNLAQRKHVWKIFGVQL